MTNPTRHEFVQPHIAMIQHDANKIDVSCRIMFDGIEYVGRLWFGDPANPNVAIPDRSALPGRDREEVLALAKRLTPAELALRYRRAIGEKRRFLALRFVTDEILVKIRYLNQVAVAMRDGLLDEEGASQE